MAKSVYYSGPNKACIITYILLILCLLEYIASLFFIETELGYLTVIQYSLKVKAAVKIIR